MTAPILSARGGYKIERPDDRRDIPLSAGCSILQPPAVGKIGTEFGL